MEIGNYIFPVPLGGFGGLEMQMAKRAKDIINKGGNSLLITLENSRLDKYANELGISTVYAKPKRKYFDLDLAKIIAYNSKKIIAISVSLAPLPCYPLLSLPISYTVRV